MTWTCLRVEEIGHIILVKTWAILGFTLACAGVWIPFHILIARLFNALAFFWVKIVIKPNWTIAMLFQAGADSVVPVLVLRTGLGCTHAFAWVNIKVLRKTARMGWIFNAFAFTDCIVPRWEVFLVKTFAWATTTIAFLGIPEETGLAFNWRALTVANLSIPVEVNWT